MLGVLSMAEESDAAHHFGHVFVVRACVRARACVRVCVCVLCVCVCLCVFRFNVLFNNHIATVSGCDREFNAHFYNAASPWYHFYNAASPWYQVPDT